jgi:hypothetical protein
MMLRKGSLSREVLRDTATEARDWVLFGLDMTKGWVRYHRHNTFMRLAGIRPSKRPNKPNTPRL